MKGTLTIFNNHENGKVCAVLGWPSDVSYDEDTIEMAEYWFNRIEGWIKEGGILGVPFPVEVIDLRDKKDPINES